MTHFDAQFARSIGIALDSSYGESLPEMGASETATAPSFSEVDQLRGFIRTLEATVTRERERAEEYYVLYQKESARAYQWRKKAEARDGERQWPRFTWLTLMGALFSFGWGIVCALAWAGWAAVRR